MKHVKAEEITEFMKAVKISISRDREATKRLDYENAEKFFAEYEGLTRTQVCALWRKALGDGYETKSRYYRGIHTWQESGIEYPYEMSVSLLFLTRHFPLEVKREFVTFWKSHPSRSEIKAFIEAHPNVDRAPDVARREKAISYFRKAVALVGMGEAMRLIESISFEEGLGADTFDSFALTDTTP